MSIDRESVSKTPGVTPEPSAGEVSTESNSQPLLTRRQVGGLGFVATAAGVIGVFTGYKYGEHQKESEEEAIFSLPGSSVDRDVSISLVVVSPEGKHDAAASQEIEEIVTGQLERLGQTLFGEWSFRMKQRYSATVPTEEIFHYGQLTEVCSEEELRKISKQYAGQAAITLLALNSINTGDPNLAGRAMQQDSKKTTPWCYVCHKNDSPGTYPHELGHLLNPRKLGFGLNHQKELNCQQTDSEGNITQVAQFDTIQRLVAEGNGLEKTDYASELSVMGNSHSFPTNDENDAPLLSAPELAFLLPESQVYQVEPGTVGTYHISYDPSGWLGARIAVPEDHVLRELLPETDTLFFGPIIPSVTATFPDGRPRGGPIDKIGVFATGDHGRTTTWLNVGQPYLISYDDPDQAEGVVFADEQLNTLVLSGRDSEGVYLRLVPLDTPEGQAHLATERQRLEEYNAAVLGDIAS